MEKRSKNVAVPSIKFSILVKNLQLCDFLCKSINPEMQHYKGLKGIQFQISSAFQSLDYRRHLYQ